MNVKTMATSGIIAALYVAVTLLVAPFGFTIVQFRISEMFNHLIVFNKKYILRHCPRCIRNESIFSIRHV